MSWTIGHDEPFDEYECEGDCEDECTCLEDGDYDEDEDITQIIDKEQQAAEHYHASFPHGWSPE